MMTALPLYLAIGRPSFDFIQGTNSPQIRLGGPVRFICRALVKLRRDVAFLGINGLIQITEDNLDKNIADHLSDCPIEVSFDPRDGMSAPRLHCSTQIAPLPVQSIPALSRKVIAIVSTILDEVSAADLAHLRQANPALQLVVDIQGFQRLVGKDGTVMKKACDTEFLRHADIIKANEEEFVRQYRGGIAEAAQYALENRKAFLVTLGSKGVLLIEEDGAAYHVPASSITPSHPVGAGDSFLAFFCGILPEVGYDKRQAVVLAQEEVRKLLPQL